MPSVITIGSVTFELHTRSAKCIAAIFAMLSVTVEVLVVAQ